MDRSVGGGGADRGVADGPTLRSGTAVSSSASAGASVGISDGAAPPARLHRMARPTPHDRWLPPPAEARLGGPDKAAPCFVITVDVEEEFDWSRPFARSGHGLETLPLLAPAHERLCGAGARIDYLVDWPVADDGRLPDILGRAVAAGEARVGAQLHPWVNPPFAEAVSVPNSFAGNLPPLLEAEKIGALTRRITTALGRAPRVYRAGRYGLGASTFGTIAALGYVCDTSIRSGFGYHRQHGPDFRAMPAWPWRTPDGPVELPPTTLLLGALTALGPLASTIYHRLAVPNSLTAAALARARLVERVPLTPEGVPADRACAAIDAAIEAGLPILNLSFHSPSLAPGHTPYVRDAGDLATFWAWWDRVLAHLARRGVRGCLVEDAVGALHAACQAPGGSANAAAVQGPVAQR